MIKTGMNKLDGVCYACGYPIRAETGAVIKCPFCAAANRAVIRDTPASAVKLTDYAVPALAALLFLFGGKKR